MHPTSSEASPAALKPRSSRLLEEAVWVALLSVSLSIAVCFVSNNLSGRFELRGKNIQNQFAILDGQPQDFGFSQSLYIPAFQNRVLFPALLRLAGAIKLFSVPQWYLLLRLLSAVALFAAYYVTLRRHGRCDRRLASAGAGLLAYALLMTFNHPYEHTSDFPDALFTTAMLACVLSNRPLWLLLVCLVAAANRESAAFGGVVWFAVHGLRGAWSELRWKAALQGGGITAAAYAAVLGLRYHFGGIKAVSGSGQALTGWTELAHSIRDVIHAPTPSSWPLLAFAMLTPLVGWLAVNRPFCILENRRIVAAGALIGMVTLLFGLIHELRVFIPSLVLLCYAATSSEAERQSALLHARGVAK